jgi:hypothetical protein
MSHTATGEWKSFEVRMSHRRAERLVARADVAVAAGSLEEARTSLEEARALWPTVPGLIDVQQKIVDVQQKIEARGVAAAKTGVPSRWLELAAATLAVAFGASAAGLLLLTPQPMVLPAPPPVAMFEVLPSRDLTAAVDAISIVDRERGGDRGTGVDRETGRGDQGSGIGGQPSVPQDHGAGTSNRAPEIETPAPVPAEAPIANRTPPRPAIPDPPPPIPDVAASTAPSPVVLAASNSATVQPPQEALIRNALGRYAAAYTDLDVDAAGRVWPSVNRTALGRAFASLESQRVSLRECRIEVDGNAAHASCDGSATWTPKIGGGAHTDERSWSFDLEKASAGWQIVSTHVQNR